MIINNNQKLSSNSGFTLIELMISLVLGLLISAAVLQVYMINTQTITIQKGASEVQDGTIFALQAVEKNIRMANLGNPVTNITDTTIHGGIVLTADNIGDVTYPNTGYMTISAGQTGTTGNNGWTGVSNTDVDSDQLTIQYQNITPDNLFDCEGEEIASGSNLWVIERYFVRATDDTQITNTKDLALVCDAGRITDSGVVTDFGDEGQVVIQAVDQFQVLLGTLTDVAQMTYLPAQTYLTLTDKPAITAIKIGVIIRSSTPLINSTDKEEFIVLDKAQTLKADEQRKQYYRRDYESTVLLRNARVMSMTGTPLQVTP